MFLITGYPKTGNTWLHVMISYVMNPNAMIDGTMKSPINSMFSHCMPNFNRELYSQITMFIPGDLPGKRIVLLIRHPGDTLVSLYMHNIYRERFPMYNGTIDEMVYDDIYGIQKFLLYYEWWWQHRKIPDLICVIRYEDLIENIYETFNAMWNAIRITVTEQTVRNAIKFGNFKNMQLLEKTNHLNWPTLYKSRNKIKKALKVRKGKIGEYRKLLKPETIKYIDNHITKHLHPIYGYA